MNHEKFAAPASDGISTDATAIAAAGRSAATARRFTPFVY